MADYSQDDPEFGLAGSSPEASLLSQMAAAQAPNPNASLNITPQQWAHNYLYGGAGKPVIPQINIPANVPDQAYFQNDPENGMAVDASPTSALLAQLNGPRKNLDIAGEFPVGNDDPNEGQVRGLQGLYAKGKPTQSATNDAMANRGSFLNMMLGRGDRVEDLPSITGAQAGATEGMNTPNDPMGLAKDLQKARTLTSVTSRQPRGGVDSGNAHDSDDMKTLNMGKGTELGTVENLRNVQKGVNDATMVNRMGEAFNQIGAGISRLQPSAAANKVYEENIADAGKGVKQFEDQVAQQDTDPNSARSQGFRDFMKQFNVKVQGDFTAADGKALLPFAFKSFEADQQREAHSQDLETKMKYLAEMKRSAIANTNALREQTRALQIDKQHDADEKDFVHQWDTIRGKRGFVGSPQAKVQMADNLDAMLQGSKSLDDLNKVNPQMYNEFMSAYTNMLTGGQASDTRFKELVARNGIKDAANFWQFLSAHPTGAQQGPFIQMFKNSARNQANQAQAQVDDAFMEHYNNRQDRLSPQFKNRALYGNGISPEQAQQWSSGGFQARAKLSPAEQQHLDEFLARNPDANIGQAIKALREKKYIQ